MPSNVLVSGAGSTFCDGLYVYDGVLNDKSSYRKNNDGLIFWEAGNWYIYDNGEEPYQSLENVEYPWLVTSWNVTNGLEPAPTFTEVPVSSQNTFGLPADIVALITSRFGSVANFLRLRNQGQV